MVVELWPSLIDGEFGEEGTKKKKWREREREARRGGDILILSRSRALDRIVLVRGQVVRMIVCQTTQIKRNGRRRDARIRVEMDSKVFGG